LLRTREHAAVRERIDEAALSPLVEDVESAL